MPPISDGARRVDHEHGERGAGHRRDQRGQRGIMRRQRDVASHSRAAPSATGQASTKQHAERGRHPLAAAKAEPDREHVADDHRAAAGDQRRLRAPAAADQPPRRHPSRHRAARVSAASALLPVRKTLVAPILPEPIRRMSPMPGRAGSAPARTGSSPAGSRRWRRGEKSDHRRARLLRRCAPRNDTLDGSSLRAQRSNLVGRDPGSSLAPEDRAAVDDRALDPALHRAAVERRVLRFRAELVGVDPPRRVGIEQRPDRPGAAATSRPTGRPRIRAGPQVSRRITSSRRMWRLWYSSSDSGSSVSSPTMP